MPARGGGGVRRGGRNSRATGIRQENCDLSFGKKSGGEKLNKTNGGKNANSQKGNKSKRGRKTTSRSDP